MATHAGIGGVSMRRFAAAALVVVSSLVSAAKAQPAAEGPKLRLPTGYVTSASAAVAAKPNADQLYVLPSNDIYPAEVPSGPYTNFWGIFIGISKYRNISGLANAEHDAVDFASTLKQYSTVREPIVLTNEDATVENLRRRLRELAPQTTPNDLVLIHFSGHGIGLGNKINGEQAGYLMFHDAQSPATITKTGDTTDLLNMQMVDDVMTEAGIKFKHRLITLDCCFSGFGARVPAQARGLKDRSVAAENWLRQSADLVLSAGHAGQEVLDGSMERKGYGLATGVLIDTIRQPGNYQVTPIDVNGTQYLDAVDLFRVMQSEVPAAAKEVLEGIYKQRAADPGAPSYSEFVEDPNPVLARFPPPKANSLRQVLALGRQLQTPQSINRGTGTPLIPLRSGVALPNAEDPPARTSPDSPSPGDATPVATTGAKPVWDVWKGLVSVQWGNEAYGESVSKFLKVLYTGAPSTDDAVAINMSVSTAIQTCRFAPPGQRQWEPIKRVGASVPEGNLVRYILRNNGDQELYYYVIGVDQSGVVQWVAPGAPANKSWPEYSFGPRTIKPRTSLTLPESTPEHPDSGQPVAGAVAQNFYFIFTTKPWDELERTVSDAGLKCQPLYEKDGGAKGALPAAPVQVVQRALGRVRATANVQDALLPTILNAESNVLIESWHMGVFEPEQKSW